MTKIRYLKALWTLTCISLTAIPVVGQDEEEEEVFDLSPFVVDTSQDSGYLASSTLAGTRLNTSLDDVGAAIQVVTQEFMDDVGATDYQGLLLYTTNTETAGLEGNFSGATIGSGERANSDEVLNNPFSVNRIRGLAAPDRTRDYFLTSIPFDMYNSDRVDVSRGANSILFGLGSPAGILNGSLKKAMLSESFGEIEYRLSSGSSEGDLSHRGSLDYNLPVVKDRLAVRVAAMKENQKYNQDPAFRNTDRYYLTLTGKLWKGATIRASYENGDIDANHPDNLAPVESLSSYLEYRDRFQAIADANGFKKDLPAGWDPANLPLYADPFQFAIRNEALYVRPDQLVNGWPNSPSGLHQQGSRVFRNIAVVYDDPYERDPTMAFVGVVRNQEAKNGAAYAAFGGAPPDYVIPANGRIQVAQFLGVVNKGYQTDYEEQALLDRSVFDWVDHLLGGTAGSQVFDFEAKNASFEQLLLDGILGFDVSAYDERFERENANPFRGTGSNIQLDVNKTLPTGEVNPNFGRPYIADRITINDHLSERDGFRATAFLDLDIEERFLSDTLLGRILGKHTLTGMYAEDNTSVSSRNIQEAWTSDDPDIESVLAQVVGTKAFQRQVAYLNYIGPPVDILSDPGSLALSDFIVRPNTIVDQEIPQPGGIVDNVSFWNPNAPDQISYFSLNRTPYIRGGSDVEEAVESKVAVVQSYWLDDALITTLGYREDDLFQHSETITDYGEVASTRNQVVSGKTDSFGLVLRLPRMWRHILPSGTDFSLFYNKSNNIAPEAGRLDTKMNIIPSPEGETEEFGFNLSLMDQKLHMRVNFYESSAKNITNRRIGSLANRMMVESVHRNIQFAIDGLYQVEDPGAVDPDGVPVYGNYDNVPQFINELAGLYGASIDLDSKTLSNDPNHPYAKLWEATNPSLVLAPDGSVQSFFYDNPSGLTGTQDSVSEGVEIELVYNPTRNWRMMLSVAETETMTANSLPRLTEALEYIQPVIYGTAGNYSFVGATKRNTPPQTVFPGDELVGDMFEADVLKSYYAIKALDGTMNPEQRKWRASFVTNYNFRDGFLDGFDIGGTVRWQDQVGIGYPLLLDEFGNKVPDVSNPYYGPEEWNVGLRVGYRRKFNFGGKDIIWILRLHVDNITNGKNDYIPVVAHYDGSIAQLRTPSVRTWQIISRFKF